MSQLRKAWLISFGLTLTLLTTAAGAADVNRLLPNDTGAVVTINVRQLLDSEIVKKHALDMIKQGLKDQADAQKVLDALGLDPLKDIDQVILASPELSESPDKGLLIVSGRFDAAKVKAKAAEVAKNQADVLKIAQNGAHEIYEIKVPDQAQPVFAALADGNTLVAGPTGRYVLDAMDKANGKEKTAFKNKEIPALLAQVDGKQSIWVAVGSSAMEKGLPAGIDDNVKEFLKKLDAIAGGITAADDVKAQVVLSAKDAQGAKELHQVIDGGIQQGIGVLALLAANQKELAPLLDIIKTIKTNSKDRSVIITGAVTADVIEKAIKIGQ